MHRINLFEPIVGSNCIRINNRIFFFSSLVSFDTPSTLAISIYSLFYLLYILYPNILRRELQTENNQTTTLDTPSNRLGVERVLLVNFEKKKK